MFWSFKSIGRFMLINEPNQIWANIDTIATVRPIHGEGSYGIEIQLKSGDCYQIARSIKGDRGEQRRRAQQMCIGYLDAIATPQKIVNAMDS